MNSVENFLFHRQWTNGSYELWKTDGTVNGTVMVKDILSITGYNGGVNGWQTGQEPLISRRSLEIHYFSPLMTQSDGYELWKSDGTEVAQ